MIVHGGRMVIHGGGWLFVLGIGRLYWGMVAHGGGWSYVVGDGRSWMGVVVRGGGSLFVVVWVCGVVVRVGSSSMWGHCPCGAWSSVGGCCHLCVRCGRPWGVIVICAWDVVIR